MKVDPAQENNVLVEVCNTCLINVCMDIIATNIFRTILKMWTHKKSTH